MPETNQQVQPEATVITQTIIQRESVSDVMLAAISMVGHALSARFLLFLSLGGAFTLAIFAMTNQTVMSIAILGLYAAVTIIPLSYLELRTRKE